MYPSFILDIHLSSFPNKAFHCVVMDFTYPSFILDLVVSIFLNKPFHCVVMTFAGCKMQGGFLIRERNVSMIAI